MNNPVFLAPMAGVTDWAFRTVCAELEAIVNELKETTAPSQENA